MRITAIANQKGGCGKTTTALHLAAGLTHRGCSVLLIDSDPQANLTLATGAQAATGLFDALNGAQITDCIQHTAICDIVPASDNLIAADLTLSGKANRLQLLADVLRTVRGYDHVIIDTPPATSTLVYNAFMAANDIVITMRPTYYNAAGLAQIIGNVQQIHGAGNKGLHIAGILITGIDKRPNVTRAMVDQISSAADQLHIPMYAAQIRRSAAVE